jgi:hypothetical protein
MLSIRAKFWDKNLKLLARNFRAIVQDYWIKHFEGAINARKCSASPNFRIKFFKRHKFSLRTPSVKRTHPRYDPDIIATYLRNVQRAAERYGADKVLNMDETSWKDVQLAGKTVAPKGSTAVVLMSGNVKASISVISTVSISGNKLSPLYILSGLTDRVRASLEPTVPRARVSISDNGWMDETIMLKYLSWANVASDNAAFALVMDSLTAHIKPRILHKAQALNIELIPVPAGLTGEY